MIRYDFNYRNWTSIENYANVNLKKRNWMQTWETTQNNGKQDEKVIPWLLNEFAMSDIRIVNEAFFFFFENIIGIYFSECF